MSTQDTTLVKKPHQVERYTEEQIEDLKKCVDPDNGYMFFMKNFFYIQSNGKKLFKPFKYQENLINSYHNYRFSVNLLPRQAGKCVSGDTRITVSKDDGKELIMTIEDFFNITKRPLEQGSDSR